MSFVHSIQFSGFSFRAAKPTDLDLVVALMAEQNTQDYGEPGVSSEILRARWETLNLAQNTWLALAPDASLAGYVELTPDPPNSFDMSLYLANNPQQVELGAYLLNLAEQCATPALPIYTRVSAANTAVMQIFRDAGYISRLSFLTMKRSLETSPEPAQWMPGLTVRAFASGLDEQAVYRVDEEASVDKGYHAPMSFDQWARRMNLYSPDFDPGLWFLACHRDEIAGVALNFYAANSKTAWIDHLSVLRSWRNQGIGKALLLHSFGIFHHRGIQQVCLSVDSKSLTNAPRLYAQVGMETILEYHIFKKG